MMQIKLNGETKEIENGISISDLISDMDLPKYFVVELNKKIIYKEDFHSKLLCDNDVVEIAVFCGGG